MMINTHKLKVTRIDKKKTIGEMAAAIQKSRDSYYKKEAGTVEITVDEVAIIANELGLDICEVNEIFFLNRLQICNSSERNCRSRNKYIQKEEK